MVNIIGKHSFLDPKDGLYRLGGEKSLSMWHLLDFFGCMLVPRNELGPSPAGFILGEESIIAEAALRAQPTETFMNVELKSGAEGDDPEWWRELQYIDDESSYLVDYPNDRDESQVRLMAYAPGPEIKGRPTSQVVSFDLKPSPDQSGKVLASGPHVRYPVLCHDEENRVTCVSANCPEGQECEVRKCAARLFMPTRTYCECVVSRPK